MSHLPVYAYDLRIWSDMYRGVPTTVLFFILLVSNRFENPKSQIFNKPSLINIFSGFKSLYEA